MTETALFFPKLNDYSEVKWSDLKVGDHFRYSCQGYGEKADTRKLVYGICNDTTCDRMTVASYKPKAEWGRTTWYLEKDSPSKQFRFYKRTKQ